MKVGQGRLFLKVCVCVSVYKAPGRLNLIKSSRGPRQTRKCPQPARGRGGMPSEGSQPVVGVTASQATKEHLNLEAFCRTHPRPSDRFCSDWPVELLWSAHCGSASQVKLLAMPAGQGGDRHQQSFIYSANLFSLSMGADAKRHRRPATSKRIMASRMEAREGTHDDEAHDDVVNPGGSFGLDGLRLPGGPPCSRRGPHRASRVPWRKDVQRMSDQTCSIHRKTPKNYTTQRPSLAIVCPLPTVAPPLAGVPR
jgi:hypothetical protein